MKHYILKDKKVVEVDKFEWMRWLKKKGDDESRVALDNIDDVRISTVFLGIDHSFGRGEPLFFETMIFGGEHDQYQERCATWEQAEEMHKTALKLINS